MGLIKARYLLFEWLFHRKVVQGGWKSEDHDGLFLGLNGRAEDWYKSLLSSSEGERLRLLERKGRVAVIYRDCVE